MSESNRVTTNTVEGYYSIFKRGTKGVYQHCKEMHLHRYLPEFDCRYSNGARLGIDDMQRTERAIKGIVGKRLTYRTPAHQMSDATVRVGTGRKAMTNDIGF